jgi:hypothetical protein
VPVSPLPVAASSSRNVVVTTIMVVQVIRCRATNTAGPV